MPINVTMEKDDCKMQIEGEMTIFAAQELKDSMLPPLLRARITEIDLSQVTEIDSAGLQLMLLAKLESMTRGNTLRFTGHSQPVQEMLDLTDMVGFFGDPVLLQS